MTATEMLPETGAADGWPDRVEARLGHLEKDVAAIKATLQHLATKADVQEAINALTWRLIAALLLGLAALGAFLKLTG